VSLNRYERKKNITLVLDAAQHILSNHYPDFLDKPMENAAPFRVVIAGGYDIRNVENVEYRAELEQYASKTLHLPRGLVEFRMNVSDADRTVLLREATAVVYTPSGEHFGIVPLEAMYVATPVVAVRSGGPIETIVHGETGCLCDPNGPSFGSALHELIRDPTLARSMGQRAREHVQRNFGPSQQQAQLIRLIQQCVQTRKQYRVKHYLSGGFNVGRTFTKVLVEIVIVVSILLAGTWFLRTWNVLQQDESLLSGLQRGFVPPAKNEL
jgi:alpha-1,3/alpha-1,6-mannosyltransferase